MPTEADSLALARRQAGNELFRQPVSFVLSVAKLSQLPLTDLPEVAFAGRSNVGKSSMINALFNQKKLAKTSNTPGRTQQLNYFNLNDNVHIIVNHSIMHSMRNRKWNVKELFNKRYLI